MEGGGESDDEGLGLGLDGGVDVGVSDEDEVSEGGVDDPGLTIVETRPPGSPMRSSTRERRRIPRGGDKYVSSNLFLWATDLLRPAGVDGR